jgi:flavin-dependent trigonelline monooxygenase, reductase component
VNSLLSLVEPQTCDPSRDLRTAFGTFPTGITVVTCKGTNGRMIGVTANSFVSLSLCPPLVSVAFHTAARHVPAFLECGAFAINILSREQRTLSAHFARPSECSWEQVPFRVTPSGHVLLDGVAAVFLCRLSTCHEVGDHLLLVGQVDRFAYDARAEPIAFLRGRYGSFQLASCSSVPDPVGNCTAPSFGWS